MSQIPLVNCKRLAEARVCATHLVATRYLPKPGLSATRKGRQTLPTLCLLRWKGEQWTNTRQCSHTRLAGSPHRKHVWGFLVWFSASLSACPTCSAWFSVSGVPCTKEQPYVFSSVPSDPCTKEQPASPSALGVPCTKGEHAGSGVPSARCDPVSFNLSAVPCSIPVPAGSGVIPVGSMCCSV